MLKYVHLLPPHPTPPPSSQITFKSITSISLDMVSQLSNDQRYDWLRVSDLEPKLRFFWGENYFPDWTKKM